MTEEENVELSGEGDSKVMGIWDHVEELGKSLKIVLYTFVISTVLLLILPGDLSFLSNFGNYQFLVAVILRMIKEHVLPPEVKLVGLGLTDPMELYAMASITFALAITFPVLAYRIYEFVNPALYRNERNAVYPFFTSFSILFLTGLTFGYLILAPYMIRAMLPFFSAVGAEMFIDIMGFYTLMLETTLLMGIFFTSPVFLVLLVKFGVISTKLITKNRKYLYGGLLIMTFFVTPDGGMVGNILLFFPMAILLEGGLLFASRYEKKEVSSRFNRFRRRTKCKFCGADISSDTVICPECGKSTK